MNRLGSHVLAVLTLIVPVAASAGETPTAPAASSSTPPAECALYSIEGIRLGMTAEEAEAATPELEWRSQKLGTMITRVPTLKGGEPLDLRVRLSEGRVTRVDRTYVGMSQAGVRAKFVERFGPPSQEIGFPSGTGSSNGLERGGALSWDSPACNVRVMLRIQGEEDWRGAEPPAASVLMEGLVVEATPPRGPANVKF